MQYIIHKIIPTIKIKWPPNSNKDIIIKQDNGKPHIHDYDLDFINTAQSNEIHISLANQSVNSTDLNITELGFFPKNRVSIS